MIAGGMAVRVREASGCAASRLLRRAANRKRDASSSCTTGGMPLSRCRAAIGVVLHTGSTARMDCLRHLLIFLIRDFILVDTSLDDRHHEGRVRPGYQASAPKRRTGSTHARTACLTSDERGPCFVFVRLRRWRATACALAVHFSTCVLRDSVLSSQIPSHRIAASGRFTISPCITGGESFAVRSLEKCMTSVLAGSKEIPLAAPQSTSSSIL